MGIVDRSNALYFLSSGILSITALFNCSAGQRQLILGNFAVGKTSLVSQIAFNLNVCSLAGYGGFYPFLVFMHFIGSSKKEFIYHQLKHCKAFKYFNFFINSTISVSLYSQIMRPFRISESCLKLGLFGFKSLHILDSLDNHAKLYRNLMLDLKRSPGREAFPGDVFYLHSKLLEGYGQFSRSYNLGACTSFPVTGIFNNDITKYITTNLISITDGQWFLSHSLKIKGLFPCIDLNLSVSRLGLVSQSSVLKLLSTNCKVFIQYYFLLLEQKKAVKLTSSQNLVYLKSFFIYKSFFLKEALSYFNLVFYFFLSLVSSSFVYCRSYDYFIMLNFFVFKLNLLKAGVLLFWGFRSSSKVFIEIFFNYLASYLTFTQVSKC